jgi:hypothetical protein
MSQFGLYPSSKSRHGLYSISLLAHGTLTCAAIFHSRLYNIFFGNLFTITGHPTLRSLLSRCFGHIMVTACAVGDPGLVIAARMGSFTFFRPLAVSRLVWMYPLPQTFRFHASKPRTQRKSCFFFFCVVQLLCGGRVAFDVENQGFHACTTKLTRNFLFSQSLPNTRAFFNF